MTDTIQKAICTSEVLKFNTPCENVKYLFSDWESDVLSLNKGGYISEFEVKINRSDFTVDKNKRKFGYYNRGIHELMPNRFYYVCPDNLISPEEIPSFSGLIYYNESGELQTIKRAPLIHRIKHDRGRIIGKFIRLFTERRYLGCARLTYENRLSEKAWEEYNI